MGHKLFMTTVEGATGRAISTLLTSDPQFSDKLSSFSACTLDESHPHVKRLIEEEKYTIITSSIGDGDRLAEEMKKNECDTMLIIPPAAKDKLAATRECVKAAADAGVQNLVLLSMAGCDMAERDAQPGLREWIDIEKEVLGAKGEEGVATRHSPCVIRAGFYAENLFQFNKAVRESGKLQLPMGPTHKFAPVAIQDVAKLVAYIVTGEGPQGLDNKHRGQLITLTGPMMVAGEELAQALSDAVESEVSYEDIEEDEASKLLDDSDIDKSEKQLLLETYALVREGKMNYISTHAYHDITGQHPTELTGFFKSYKDEFKPSPPVKKRKTSSK